MRYTRFPADRHSRRGVTLVLLAVASIPMLILGALALNWSYIELTRTQLRAATDAAAKAALITLSESQSEDDAREAAREAGRTNLVAGHELLLLDSDIEFGNSQRQGTGKYTFVPGDTPINSVRVNAKRTEGSPSGKVPVFLSGFLATDSFSAAQLSTATRIDHDVCFVVDRSGSMGWDLSGDDFSYPEEQAEDSTLQNYFRPPHATASRWASLINALTVFKQVIDERDLNAQIGLASYSSDYAFGVYSSEEATIDQVLSKNTADYLAAAIAIGQQPVIGDTNIAAGMIKGREILVDPSLSRFTAQRTLVLLTDGVRTEGLDPVDIAYQLVGDKITIHTVTFSAGADQAAMVNVATIGQGDHYHAVSDEQLQDAFRQIAEQLPAVLTQ